MRIRVIDAATTTNARHTRGNTGMSKKSWSARDQERLLDARPSSPNVRRRPEDGRPLGLSRKTGLRARTLGGHRRFRQAEGLRTISCPRAATRPMTAELAVRGAPPIVRGPKGREDQ